MAKHKLNNIAPIIQGIMVEDLVNSEPFNNYDLSEFFGVYLSRVVGIINVLHNVISYASESDALKAAEPVTTYRYR